MTTQARGRGDAVPAVQPGLRGGRRGQPARTRTATRPPTSGSEVWQRDTWLDLLARFVHVERPEKGSAAERRAQDEGHLPALPPVGRGAQARGARARARRRAELPGAALGRVGQVELDRLARAPALELHDAADRKVFDKVVVITDRVVLDRQLQEHDLPVRARARRRRADRQGLGPARRGARGRAGADHHHDAAEVPVRPRQGRRAAGAPLRGDRGRGALLADGRGGEGPAARARRGGRGGASSSEAEAEDAAEEAERGDGQDLLARSLEGAGPAAEPLLLRVHGDAEGEDAGALRHAGRRGRGAALRAVPPLLDAPGDRGGLHPRRARELHDLQDLLPDREGDHGRPGVRPGAGRSARSRGS